MDQHMDTGQHTNPWLEAARSVPTTKQPNARPTGPGSTTGALSESSLASAEARTPEPATAPTQAIAGENLPVRHGLRPLLVSVHGGTGATTWSRILSAIDAGHLETWAAEGRDSSAPVVLVLRASVEGVAAAKTALATYGAGAFAAALVVAAGPGKAPRRISGELKILGGAIATIHIPWVPELLLKRSDHILASDIPAKELSKLTTALTRQGVPTEGETP